MIYYKSGLLPVWGPKTPLFPCDILCFLLIFEMFNEPYLHKFPGDLSLILWERVSFESPAAIHKMLVSATSDIHIVFTHIFYCEV